MTLRSIRPDAPSRRLPKAHLHRRLLTLDAHLDAPVHFARAGWSFGDRHRHATELAQLDLPRMRDGNLTGGFFVIYTPQGPLTPAGYAEAFASAVRRSREIDDMIAQNSAVIALARRASEVERLHEGGMLVCLKSIENSYPVGDDLRLLDAFANWGVRLAGPVHGKTNQLADSATDEQRWSGMSPLGFRWVDGMNRAGMIVDASHASDRAFDQLLERSTTPIMLSHSGSRSIHDDPRNIDDTRLRALAATGGAIGFATIYLSKISLGAERAALFADLGRINSLDPGAQARLTRRWRSLDRSEPIWNASFDDYMRALLHVIDVVGVDHVSFGADFDGGGGIPGLEDVTALPRITERLQAEHFTDEEIAKLWSGNLLRVLRAAEDRAEARPDEPKDM